MLCQGEKRKWGRPGMFFFRTFFFLKKNKAGAYSLFILLLDYDSHLWLVMFSSECVALVETSRYRAMVFMDSQLQSLNPHPFVSISNAMKKLHSNIKSLKRKGFWFEIVDNIFLTSLQARVSWRGTWTFYFYRFAAPFHLAKTFDFFFVSPSRPSCVISTLCRFS